MNRRERNAAKFSFSWHLRYGDGLSGGGIARARLQRDRIRRKHIPADVDIVVVGNVIKRGNPEVEAVLNRKLFYLSLPEVLKNYFLRGHHNLVVTGTHGKTTTTALLAWIMTSADHRPSYMIGG